MLLFVYDKHPQSYGNPRLRTDVRTGRDGNARIGERSEWILTFPLMIHGEFVGYRAMWCIRKNGFRTMRGSTHGNVEVVMAASDTSAACPERAFE